jgi:acyl-CoA thioesterase FadM
MARMRLEYPERTLFTTELPVRITDLNYGNHLGHDRLVSLLHEARVRFFTARGFTERDVVGAAILLVDLAVTYHREVFYGQTLRVEVGLAGMASRGCDFAYRVTDRESGELVALARTGIVFVDPATRRVVSVPSAFRALAQEPVERPVSSGSSVPKNS